MSRQRVHQVPVADRRRRESAPRARERTPGPVAAAGDLQRTAGNALAAVALQRVTDRKSVKALPTAAEARRGRQERFIEAGKERREEARRSARTRRPPWDTAINDVPAHLAGPSYTSSGKRGAGGRRSTATIAGIDPAQFPDTDADSSLPKSIVAVRQAEPGIKFIAGHLLNAAFGGDGKNANNLTILSSAGNSNCKGFDEEIKRGLTDLRSTYRALYDWGEPGLPLGKHRLGIAVTAEVDTSATWRTTYPKQYSAPLFDAVFTNLRFSAAEVGAPPAGAPEQFDRGWEAVKKRVSTANARGAVIKNPPRNA